MGIEEREEGLLYSDPHQQHRGGESGTVLVVVVEEVEAYFDGIVG